MILKLYHKNPRVITEKQFKDLRQTLPELGDLGGIVHDLNSDEVIGGNQRVRAMGLIGVEPVIVERYDPPNEQGTVAVGYYEVNGEQFKYRAVRWTPEQSEKANIIANKAGGMWDFDMLANDFEMSDLLQWGFEEGELLGLDISDDDNPYSKNIEAPIYTPKGEKPLVSDLLNSSKTDELVEAIESSDIPESEKGFLRAAARRHTVFNYHKIADYYAHSDGPVQALMENSGLVIIDFNKAIELGFVDLAAEFAKLYLGDYGDEK